MSVLIEEDINHTVSGLEEENQNLRQRIRESEEEREILKRRINYLEWELIKLKAERNYLSGEVDRKDVLMRQATEALEGKDRIISQLKKEVEEFEKELIFEKRKPFMKTKKESSPEEEPKRKGAPRNHKGGGRKKPQEIHRRRDVYPRKCPQCHSEHVRSYEKYEPHYQWDILLIVKPFNTEFRNHYGKCLDCGKVFLATEGEEEIKNARIGVNIRTIAGYLRHRLCVPRNKIKDFFVDLIGFSVSEPALLGFDYHTAEKGEFLIDEIKKLIRASEVVYMDETGWSRDGERGWMWAAQGMIEELKAALYKIDKSRGAKVAEEILSRFFRGILSSDCLKSYDPVKAGKKQKCNPHFLRSGEEAKQLTASELDLAFLEGLKNLIKGAIDGWKSYHEGTLTLDDLKSLKRKVSKKLKKLVSMPVEHKKVKNLRDRVIKYKKDIFTYLDNPRVEPTNNTAERLMKLAARLREISYGSRSDRGADALSANLSMMKTCELNGGKYLTFLKKFLSTHDQEELKKHLFNKDRPVRGP
jgi:transposase